MNSETLRKALGWKGIQEKKEIEWVSWANKELLPKSKFSKVSIYHQFKHWLWNFAHRNKLYFVCDFLTWYDYGNTPFHTTRILNRLFWWRKK